jgi:hypothetical protein
MPDALNPQLGWKGDVDNRLDAGNWYNLCYRLGEAYQHPLLCCPAMRLQIA